jgi:hypothetical protein
MIPVSSSSLLLPWEDLGETKIQYMRAIFVPADGDASDWATANEGNHALTWSKYLQQ